jgi:hypothetical protein
MCRVDQTTTQSSNACNSKNNLDNIYSTVQETVQQYDLIAFANQLPESLVVLKIVLDLDHGDILALSWKSSGPYYAQQQQKQQSQQQRWQQQHHVCSNSGPSSSSSAIHH